MTFMSTSDHAKSLVEGFRAILRPSHLKHTFYILFDKTKPTISARLNVYYSSSLRKNYNK